MKVDERSIKEIYNRFRVSKFLIGDTVDSDRVRWFDSFEEAKSYVKDADCYHIEAAPSSKGLDTIDRGCSQRLLKQG